ncbi:MAG: hypothetical protein GC185_01300 [Alphaproteobacteria bacterium]|nr:hypothetical protein [Alphaproteobacteria bacterium]
MSDKKLDQHQLESAKEIVIPINIRGLAKGLTKICYEAPVDLYKKITRKVDDLAVNKRMRQGFFAFATMPLSIMLRNGSRAAHQLADGKYKNSAQVVGGIGGAGAGWWVAGKALFGVLATHMPVAVGVVGKIGAVAIAGAVSLPVVIPAFMVGTLATATVVGAAITALSVVPAVANVKSGLKRTFYRVKGVKDVNFDSDAALEAIKNDSLSSRYERETYSRVSRDLHYMSEEGQKDIYERLKEKFGKAASNDNAEDAQQQQAQPAAKKAAAPAKKTP